MFVAIGTASAILGVCKKTLRRWHKKNYLIPFRTKGGHRRYQLEAPYTFLETGTYTIIPTPTTGKAAIYVRVCSAKQRKDLETRATFLAVIAQTEGFRPVIYKDIASGLNERRIGLLRLLRDALRRQVDCIYVTYPDRMARFGSSLLTYILNLIGIPIYIAHSPPQIDTEQQLVKDVIALMTSFSGKIHRMRRGKNTLS